MDRCLLSGSPVAIAYLVSDFPKPSETFVSRELLTLQKLGLELAAFSFTAPSAEQASKLDPVTRKLVERVSYLTPGEMLREAHRWNWSKALAAWQENHAMQDAVTCKSNAQWRWLRVLGLAQRLEAAGISHLHAHWPYATQVAYQVHKLTGLPFSVSIHAHEVEHDWGHFPKVFESVSFATFCNRAAMERLLVKLPPAARDRAHLVYHGVDLERFACLPTPPLTGPLRIISAGRLTPSKGFDRLVRACAAFHRAGGQIELTILGQGGQESALRSLAAEQNFASCLHLPGWLPHHEVAQQLARSHVFALMADTNFHDGLPNVVLEAMASGRPVVISPLPAAAEAVTDGCEGFVLNSPTDEAGLVDVLRKLAAHPDRLPAMGAAARHRMEMAFDEMVHGRRLKALFENGQVQNLPSAIAA